MRTHRLIRFTLNRVSFKAMVSSQDKLIDLPTSLHLRGRLPVRLLHLGLHHDYEEAAGGESPFHRERDPPLSSGQSVPLLRLSADHRRGEGAVAPRGIGASAAAQVPQKVRVTRSSGVAGIMKSADSGWSS